MRTALQYLAKEKTFIKVSLLPKARKKDFEEDVIQFEIQSVTSHVAGVMTEEEAILLANGLINAVTMKLHKEKRI